MNNLIKTNEFIRTPPTANEMLGYINAANVEYQHAKTGAMKSAANAYLVWHFAESANAEPTLQTWLNGEIEAQNVKINAFNDAVDNKRRRAKDYANGKLNDELTDEEKAALVDEHKRLPKDWAALKQVKIGARNGASEYTRIVKYVFEFVKPDDASNISRYAKVLEYIEDRKGDLGGDFTIDAIVKLLTKVGGFEAAIQNVRGNPTENGDDIRKAKLEKIKTAVGNTTVGQIALQPKYAQGGYVFLLGVADQNQVNLCGELKLTVEESEGLLLKVDADALGLVDPFVEFAGRAASLGELVRDGRESTVTIEDTKVGKKHKVTRTYCLAHHIGQTKLVVSARYTDVSAIIHAVPKPAIDIGTVAAGQIVMLQNGEGATFAKEVIDPGYRTLLTVTARQGDEDTPVFWDVIKELTDRNEPNELAWGSLFYEANRPIDVRDYDPTCTITLTGQQVRSLSNALVKWDKARQDDQKVAKPLSILFDGVTLTVGHEVYGSHVEIVGNVRSSPVTLSMRPSDLVDLCKKLLELDVQHCVMGADANGLLAVNWGDDVGEYTVYLPAAELRGGLNKSCVRYMRPTA